MDEQNIQPKPIDLPEYARVPRWLILQGEIDYRYFILEQMLKEQKRRAPIELMIDEATGYGKQRLEEAVDLIAELKWLKAEYEKERA